MRLERRKFGGRQITVNPEIENNRERTTLCSMCAKYKPGQVDHCVTAKQLDDLWMSKGVKPVISACGIFRAKEDVEVVNEGETARFPVTTPPAVTTHGEGVDGPPDPPPYDGEGIASLDPSRPGDHNPMRVSQEMETGGEGPAAKPETQTEIEYVPQSPDDLMLLNKAKLALKTEGDLPLAKIAEKVGVTWQKLAQHVNRWIEYGQIEKNEQFDPPAYSLPGETKKGGETSNAGHDESQAGDELL